MKTKADIVQKVAELTNLDEKDAKKAVTAVFQAILDSLANLEPVMITNFGTFKSNWKESYMGKNPRTSEPVLVKGYYRPAFDLAESVRLVFKNGEFDKYKITTEATDNASNECKDCEDIQ